MSLKLMIVDDHAGIRNMIRQVIAGPGDTVIECGTAEEALHAVGVFQPDCVTMDIRMPGRSAFNVIRTIREDYPAVRVVVVTSYDQRDFRQAANEAGAAGYVVKDNLSELFLLVAPERLTSVVAERV